MDIRYSEKPKEWKKFTWSSQGALLLISVLGAWRGKWPWMVVMVMAGIGLCIAIWAGLKPGQFRGWYRGGRWFGHQMGRVVGAVILTVVFVVVMTPLGLVMRGLGKDPLKRKWDPSLGSYWLASRQPGEVERMF